MLFKPPPDLHSDCEFGYNRFTTNLKKIWAGKIIFSLDSTDIDSAFKGGLHVHK